MPLKMKVFVMIIYLMRGAGVRTEQKGEVNSKEILFLTGIYLHVRPKLGLYVIFFAHGSLVRFFETFA
jgi:hypothetical protein